MQLWPHVISWRNLFCDSKKGGIGGGGWVSAWGAMHMGASLVPRLSQAGLCLCLLCTRNAQWQHLQKLSREHVVCSAM